MTQKSNESALDEWQKKFEEITGAKFVNVTPCMFDNIEPNKAMGLVCPCPKCSPRS